MGVRFTTIIVTRNRPEALALSLPLHLAQSRRPERILVIDSSDDPGPNAALAARAAGQGVPVEHRAAPKGMTVQRNIGLALVDTEVVVFPDDDSLPHPGALEAIMAVYEADAAGRIGGVGGVETRRPPPGVLDEGAGYEMRRADRLRARIAPWRTRAEDALVPDPMKLAARRLQAAMPPLDPALAAAGVQRVEWITGFRMSFRTDAIRARGFNEHLGAYALYEDIEAGFGVQEQGLALVATPQARIYHHKAPASRTGGREMGAMNVLNRAYVALRGGAPDGRLRRAIRRHAAFRTLQFRAGARSAYGRDRLAGAEAARAVLPCLLSAAPGDLDRVYTELRREILAP